MTIFEKKEFTIQDFLEVTKEIDRSARLYNSSFYLDTTIDFLNKNRNQFEPIIGIANESLDLVAALFSFDEKTEALTLGGFIDFITKENISKSAKIERDVEDGFVYECYDTIIISNDLIILQ